MFGRNKLAALVAEFLGTGVLAFVILVTRSTLGIPYFVAFAAGLAIVLLGVAVVRDLQLNPAYTLALWTARRIKTTKAVLFIIAQLLGAWAAYALYKYFLNGQPVQGVSHEYEARILVAEVLGAFVFTFVAVGALYQQAHWAVRCALLGAAYTLGSLIATVGSSGFINPAVALGANSWVWGTYVLGPVLGAVIGVNLYGILYAPARALAKSTVTKVTKVGKAKK